MLANYYSNICCLIKDMEEWAQRLSEKIWKSPIKDIQTFDTEQNSSRAWLFLLKIKHILFTKKYTKVKQN